MLVSYSLILTILGISFVTSAPATTVVSLSVVNLTVILPAKFVLTFDFDETISIPLFLAITGAFT